MKRQPLMYLILTCLFLLLFTACNQKSTSTEPILCEDFKMEGKIPIGVHIPESNELAYVCIANPNDFTGNFSDFPLEIYQMQKNGNGYENPQSFILPEGFIYSPSIALSPDGKQMYLSAQNADFFGNDSINLLVGDIDGNTLTNLQPLDAINTSNDELIMSVDKNQNLIYLAPIGNTYSQIFYAPYKDGVYSQGIVMSEAINGESVQSIGATLTPDGTKLINTHQFYQGIFYPGLLIASSLNEENKWEPATAFDLPINDISKIQLCPSISGDGKTLYYVAIDMDANMNSMDISSANIYKVDLKVALETLVPANEHATDSQYDTSDFKLTLRNKGDKSQKQGIYYEIFVRAFADSDGDGIGDFNGLTSKLDYLKDLGVEGLWLMPINASPSYHGYDVIDYTTLNSDYGTEEDFKRLLDEAHKRDIKIIMDFVINHTSSSHPWFKEATFSENSPYRDYYRIVDPSDTENYIEGAKSPWGSDVWHPMGNLYYYGIFTDSMPDLNYNNPAVREEIKNAASKWLEMGVDGFRLDAALHIYGAHEFEKQEDSTASNLQWWNEFAAACEAINPNVYLVGEAWDSDNPLEEYVQPFDTKFNFTLQSDMLYAIKNGLSITARGEDLAASIQSLLETYDSIDTNYLDGLFASNHDQERIMNSVVMEDKVHLFPHIYLTLPGNPYIYYGEELGMKGTKPDENLRVGFKWSEDPNMMPNCPWETTMWGEDFSTLNQDTPSLEVQAQDSTSLYNLYKTLIHLRKDYEALNSGDYESLTTSNMSVLGYRRFSENENLLVLHNLSSKEVTISLDALEGATLIYTSNATQVLSSNTLTLPGYTSVIYQH